MPSTDDPTQDKISPAQVTHPLEVAPGGLTSDELVEFLKLLDKLAEHLAPGTGPQVPARARSYYAFTAMLEVLRGHTLRRTDA